MDRVKRLTPFLSVSPQIAPADLATLAAHGFRAIIGNRPDGEEMGQPTGGEIAAAARRCGLEFRHIPVVSGRIRDEDVIAFAAALAELEGPVLAYCRTGTRSASLWALGEARRLDPGAILAIAGAAGYDLSALEDRLRALRLSEPATAPGRVGARSR